MIKTNLSFEPLTFDVEKWIELSLLQATSFKLICSLPPWEGNVF